MSTRPPLVYEQGDLPVFSEDTEILFEQSAYREAAASGQETFVRAVKASRPADQDITKVTELLQAADTEFAALAKFLWR